MFIFYLYLSREHFYLIQHQARSSALIFLLKGIRTVTGNLPCRSQTASNTKMFEKKKDLSLDPGNNSPTWCLPTPSLPLLCDFTSAQEAASKSRKTTNHIIRKKYQAKTKIGVHKDTVFRQYDNMTYVRVHLEILVLCIKHFKTYRQNLYIYMHYYPLISKLFCQQDGHQALVCIWGLLPLLIKCTGK